MGKSTVDCRRLLGQSRQPVGNWRVSANQNTDVAETMDGIGFGRLTATVDVTTIEKPRVIKEERLESTKFIF